MTILVCVSARLCPHKGAGQEEVGGHEQRHSRRSERSNKARYQCSLWLRIPWCLGGGKPTGDGHEPVTVNLYNSALQSNQDLNTYKEDSYLQNIPHSFS